MEFRPQLRSPTGVGNEGSHQGLNAREGAVGVGRAPTEAVVISSLSILILNFFLTFLLNMVFPYGT